MLIEKGGVMHRQDRAISASQTNHLNHFVLDPKAPGQKIRSGFFVKRFLLVQEASNPDTPVAGLILKIELNIAPFVVLLSSNGPATAAVDTMDKKTNQIDSIGTTAGLLTICSMQEQNG